MEMPKSIKLFEQLFLLSLALGVIQSALFLNASGITGDSAFSVAIFQFVILVIVGGLILLTSRKKSVICKWMLIILCVLGLFEYIPSLASFIEHGIMGLIGSAQVLLQVYAIYLLFNADSKTWFESRRLKGKSNS